MEIDQDTHVGERTIDEKKNELCTGKQLIEKGKLNKEMESIQDMHIEDRTTY